MYRDAAGNFAFLAIPAAYAVAYAPILVPAAITAISAVGAGVASWNLGAAVGYMSAGDGRAADQSLSNVQTTLSVTGAALGGVMTAESSLMTPANSANTNTAKEGSSKIHGNSLKYPGKSWGYTLRDIDTDGVLKYGESIRPDRRYSQSYLRQNNAYMQKEMEGSKQETHIWQNEQITNYLQKNGTRPSLNKSNW